MTIRFVLSFLLGICGLSASSQQTDPPVLAPGHYIVVAAYYKGQAAFANRYVSDLNQAGNHAQAGYDEVRKFYYVYLDYYADYNESIHQMLKVRKEAHFPAAWVRVMKGDPVVRPEPAAIEKKTAEPPKAEPVEVKKENVKKPEVVVQQKDSLPTPKFIPVTDVVENPKPDPVYRPQILKNTPVFLSLYNPTNNTIVAGEVDVVNTETSKLITRVKGNDYVSLPNPNSKSGNA